MVFCIVSSHVHPLASTLRQIGFGKGLHSAHKPNSSAYKVLLARG